MRVKVKNEQKHSKLDFWLLKGIMNVDHSFKLSQTVVKFMVSINSLAILCFDLIGK